MTPQDLLREAARLRVSINSAANAVEERTNEPIDVRLVIAAIEERKRADLGEPAGAYWHQCERAAYALDSEPC